MGRRKTLLTETDEERSPNDTNHWRRGRRKVDVYLKAGECRVLEKVLELEGGSKAEFLRAGNRVAMMAACKRLGLDYASIALDEES